MLLYLYKSDYPDQDVPDTPAKSVTTDSSFPSHLQLQTSEITEMETALETTPSPSEDAISYAPRMMNNVLVYAIADKYDIAELKELAKFKFQTLISSKWPHDDFHAIAEAVFSTTPDEDMGLRKIVLETCIKHFRDILKDEESRAVFLNIKAITAAALNAAVWQMEEDETKLDSAKARQSALEDELKKARKTLEDELKKARKTLEDELKEAENALENKLKEAKNVQVPPQKQDMDLVPTCAVYCIFLLAIVGLLFLLSVALNFMH